MVKKPNIKHKIVTSFDCDMSLTLETPVGPIKELPLRREEWTHYINQDNTILFTTYAFIAVSPHAVLLQICSLKEDGGYDCVSIQDRQLPDFGIAREDIIAAVEEHDNLYDDGTYLISKEMCQAMKSNEAAIIQTYNNAPRTQ